MGQIFHIYIPCSTTYPHATYSTVSIRPSDLISMAMAAAHALKKGSVVGGGIMWVTEECKKSFMEMKWKKVHRYIVFKFVDDDDDDGGRLLSLRVDKVGGPGESYDDLAACLPRDDCRYALFDLDLDLVVTADKYCRKMSKILLIAWAPAESRIRAKMLYATSKHGLRGALDGIHLDVQATDPAEMGLDLIKDRLQLTSGLK